MDEICVWKSKETFLICINVIALILCQNLRLEFCCCIRLPKTEKEADNSGCGGDEGILYHFVKQLYAPFLMLKATRMSVVCFGTL